MHVNQDLDLSQSINYEGYDLTLAGIRPTSIRRLENASGSVQRVVKAHGSQGITISQQDSRLTWFMRHHPARTEPAAAKRR